MLIYVLIGSASSITTGTAEFQSQVACSVGADAVAKLAAETKTTLHARCVPKG